jgi:hypothetical protein
VQANVAEMNHVVAERDPGGALLNHVAPTQDEAATKNRQL